ncbi:lgc-7 [Pristionchus pacificus]|uniref:Lgc-7 n=1 Tax=Pristionchus pacificus TaxID=54126 RepID=A0A2A6BAA3_PRIPA|nr:lgc-7 [Pristionchus pacificus]|eukprot:PDM62808.1 lgc-7 [Pristionchus pacificus]
MRALLLVCFFTGMFEAQRPASQEATVVKYLLSRGYDKSSRPAFVETETTLLNISVNSFSLYQMDQAKEIVEFSAEFLLTWYDPFMSWDRNMFNVTWIKMKEMYVWKPDIIVSTSIETDFLLDADERYVDIRHDGYVRQSYYGVFFNQCKMKVVNCFPYDAQECAVEIGPWSYTNAQVLSDAGNAITEPRDGFKGNSEWEFIYMIPEVYEETDKDVGFNYTAVRWQTMLKRKPEFYVWVLLVPSFIITTVSLFGIFIPTNHLGDREEKVTLGLTTLLSTAVILEIVASTMPKASALPLLGNFILAEIFITAIGVLAITRSWYPPMWMVRACEFPFRKRKFKWIDQKKTSTSSLGSTYTDEKKSALDEELEKERSDAWAIIFDRIDVYLVVLFQVANVILTLTITNGDDAPRLGTVLYFVETANQKLLKTLLNHSNYEKDIRPSNESGGPLVVTIIPNQFLLLTMDQQQETIEYFCEFMMSWVDPQLSWFRDETDYSEEWIKIPEDRIWVPDIVLSHSDLIAKSNRMVDVKYDGTVRRSSPAVIVTTCHLDIQSFPYDDQECTISIGSWIFDSTEVIVRSFYNQISPGVKFEGNNEWEFLSMLAKSVESMDDDRSYSLVEYTLQLKRKPVYYVLVIQAPTFIIGTMTLFGIFTPFSIHGERKERVTLGLTMLLSISMMFNLVSEMMPKASRLPLLGNNILVIVFDRVESNGGRMKNRILTERSNYILIEIFMCAIAVLISIVLLYLHHRVHTRVVKPPKWVLRLLHISSCGCLHKPRSMKELLPESRTTTLSGRLILETDTSAALQQLMRLRVTITKTVSMLSQTMAKMEFASIAQSTWARVFDTLDLLFLLVFQVVNVIMAVAYMRSPELYVSIIDQTLSSPPHSNVLVNASGSVDLSELMKTSS